MPAPFSSLQLQNGTDTLTFQLTGVNKVLQPGPNFFFLDFEGGDNTRDGKTYANRWRTLTSGPTAARIAPGDTIRMMSTPTPTAVGSGTWTGVIKRISAASSTSSATTPVVITATSHGLTTGDFINISGSSQTALLGVWKVNVLTVNTFELVGSTNPGGTGSLITWFWSNNTVVELATPVTAHIDKCISGWVASANVTVSTSTTSGYKIAHLNTSIAVATAFTTGLAAYKTLPAPLDLSSYEQISFWIAQTSGTTADSGSISIKLCSDTVGAVPVNTLTLDFSLGSTSVLVPVTLNNSAALGNNIQSVAFYVNTDSGAQTFRINHIIACKAASAPDSLSFNSLISKNTASETWYNIKAIDNNYVILDSGGQSDNHISSNNLGYYGANETVTTYKRETAKYVVGGGLSSDLDTFTKSGTADNEINYLGGWDRSAMMSQDGETWLDGRRGDRGEIVLDYSYLYIEKLNFVRMNCPISSTTNVRLQGVKFKNCSFNNCFIGIGDDTNTNAWTGSVIEDCFICNCNSGIVIQSGMTFLRCKLYNHGKGIDANPSVAVYPDNVNIINCEIVNAITFSITLYHINQVNFINLITASSFNATIQVYHGTIYMQNCILTEPEGIEQSLLSNKMGKIIGVNTTTTEHADSVNFINYYGPTYIKAQTAVRHTASGFAWQFHTGSNNYIDYQPLELCLARILVEAGSLVTVKAWFRRTNGTATCRLYVKSNQIGGPASQQTADMTASADTWEELTVSWTPSEVGVVEVHAGFFEYSSLLGDMYVDDVTITQA